MRKFIIKCALIDKQTGKFYPHQETIEGENGNAAVSNFKNYLEKEGKYDLDLAYTYFEINTKK